MSFSTSPDPIFVIKVSKGIIRMFLSFDFIPILWKSVRGSRKIHYYKLWQVELRALYRFMYELCIEKMDKLNDEFLYFLWSDYLNQGIKLKLRMFSIQWCKSYSGIHFISYLKLHFKKHVLFLSRDLLTLDEQL